ncbi:hypothetical protein TB2_030094 [Malus domestica]
MTSDLSNMQAVTPYASSETVTGANGEGLQISHIGQASLSTHSHTLELNSMLHDKVTNKVLYQGLSNQAVYPLPLLKPPKTYPAALSWTENK